MSEHICDFPRVSQTGRACPYCTIRELEQQLAELREENEGLLAAVESLGADNAALLEEGK